MLKLNVLKNVVFIDNSNNNVAITGSVVGLLSLQDNDQS